MISADGAAMRRVGSRPLGGVLRAGGVQAHAIVMAALFASAIVVAYILLPGEGERIAMLQRDGKTREARAILESEYNNGDRRQRTLFQLEQLYEDSGDLPQARKMFELLTEGRPRDATLQRQYGLFLRQTHDEAAYITSLGQQIAVRYSEAACRELIGLLRRAGDYKQERAALETCRQKGYRRPDDMVRLASLLAVDGEIKEASVLLRAVDDLRRLKVERERLQLFDLLIENGQPNEAERRGARWVKGNKDDGLALTLISLLVVANRHDLAIELARETSVPGDSVFLTIPEIMVERREFTAAEVLLRGWFEKAESIDGAVAQRFIQAALSAGAPDLAFACAQKVGLATLGPDAILDMARGLEAIGRKSDADALRLSAGLGAPSSTVTAASKPSFRDRARAWPGFRVASLDQWRSELWKRMASENKLPPPLVTLPVSANAAHAARPLRGFKALHQARRLSSYRRRLNAPPAKKLNAAPFDFSTVKPGP